MEPRIMAEPVVYKDKRKQRGGGGGSGVKTATAAAATNDRVHPPDKKKFEKETAEITRQIKDLEAKLKATQTDNTVQNILTELSRLQTELGETERMRGTNKTEVKKIEERLRSLGEEVIKKKDEASSLLAGMRWKTESKIDETISKLSLMLTTQHSDSEQRKYKHEIENLEKSKVKLREFTKAKDAAEKMRSEQDDLRRKRDLCYCLSKDLKEKEVKIKDKMSELKAAFDNAKERKREISAQKDSISKEINSLYEHRRQLHMSFREQQTAYQAAYQKERRLREEEERKRRENRQALKVEKFKRKLDQEMLRAVHYDEDIAIAKALISHLQANVSGASSYLGGEGESPSSSTTNLDAPDGTAAAGGVVNTRDSAVDQKPGEFIRKKDIEEEVLVPAAKWTMVRRRSKREKRKSTVPKRLNFNPAIFQQFSHLGVQPPSSHAEISAVILKLQEKLTIFESKRNPAYSVSGDSGLGGMTDAEISQVQSIATSQEDLHLITVSPNTSVTDLKLPSFPPLPHPPVSPSHHLPTEDNGGDLSDNESSQTVVEDDESSTPHSNSSLMATVATASSS